MGPSAARFVSQLQRGNRLKEWFAAVRESGSGTNLPISNVRFDGEYRGGKRTTYAQCEFFAF
jgi:hypothetical protein